MKKRIRDPVHGLVVLGDDPEHARRDATVWALLNTPEMQRLRRIRQLGVSELTFPGATHSRFAHSIGVFHNARRLVGLLRRHVAHEEWNRDRAEVAAFAALLHDVGHGPLSHAFEQVQKSRNAERAHEDWSAAIIRNEDGAVFGLLERHRRGLAGEVAELLRSDVPTDVYHAVVSSAFDADRLDYLRRDRLMTGSGAGAIDFDWLLDNIRIAEVPLGPDDDEDGRQQTFCLDAKALQSAESFLLARYHLFEQVYLHKTTRGFEQMVAALMRLIADAATSDEAASLGLDRDDPIVRFFSADGETLANFLALDDAAFWAAIGRVARSGSGYACDLALRLQNRRPLRAIDLARAYPRQPGEDPDALEQRRQQQVDRLDAYCASLPAGSAFKDVAPLSIYSEVGADQTRAHKRLAILADGTPREITQMSDVVRALQPKRNLVRFYFARESDRARAQEAL